MRNLIQILQPHFYRNFGNDQGKLNYIELIKFSFQVKTTKTVGLRIVSSEHDLCLNEGQRVQLGGAAVGSGLAGL